MSELDKTITKSTLIDRISQKIKYLGHKDTELAVKIMQKNWLYCNSN